MPNLPRIPDEAIIGAISEIYQRGQTLDAYREAESFAPLNRWGGIQGCILAARIATNTGAPRLATRLAARARRTDPRDPDALAQYGYELLGWRGPLALWQFFRELPAPGPAATPRQRAELLALKGRAATDLRHFAAAEKLIGEAESLDPSAPWIRLQRASLLEQLDRLDEALETAAQARSLHPHPFYRPAIQVSARLLQLLDRDAEAIDLLTEAGQTLQNSPVAAQLYSLLSENNRWAEAEAALARFVEVSPLLDERGHKWVLAQRSRAAYHLGRISEAAALAAAVDDDFHRQFAARLLAPDQNLRCAQLNVTFVRQHFKTCAPATLAALCRFWNLPAGHIQLAEAVCYDGTPSWQQRQWAEANGMHVREFRVTAESAIALIDQGVPFAISTVEAASAHMMAVTGFDQARRTLLLRDPGQPYIVETPIDAFLARYRPFGPRGTLFLPEAMKDRTAGILLPDAEIYDSYHRFWVALSRHDRSAATEVAREIENASNDHPIALEARLDLAAYDGNVAEQIRCLDRLLELFPDNPARLLRRIGCMREAPREERISFIKSACAADDADPVLFIELARALEGDARALHEARHWLKRAMRLRPLDSNAVSVKAGQCWEEGCLDEAAELHHFAATLEGFQEGLYKSWFLACRRTRRTDEAMSQLQDRFTRFGRRSEQPALTLAWAWRELEQPGRARDVLAEAARLRPDDGYLLLRSASLLAGLGEHAEAGGLLDAARGKVRENDWIRAAAELAEARPDHPTALHRACELLSIEPLALDAHAIMARGLAATRGSAAAIDHLKDACARFPHHCGLHRMLVDWSREAGPEAAASAAEASVAMDPSDAWVRREAAFALIRLNRGDDALRHAMEAVRIEPRNTHSLSVLGHVHRRLQQVPEARACFRAAVQLGVDNADAIQSLLELARSDRERIEELALVERELVRQVVTGDGLLTYLDLARPILDPETLLQSLRQAHSERPDLWHAWSALVSQLGHLNHLDEALNLASSAARSFPHLPRTWLDLAAVHQWREEIEAEIAAASRAFEMNPAWNRATFALARAHERTGALDQAEIIYRRALQHAAHDAQLHACHAHLLWRLRRQEDAFASVEQALRLAPGYDWAWELHQTWSADIGCPERAWALSRTLSEERPGDPRVWLNRARIVASPDAMPERIAAIKKALELDAQWTEAWDLKADLLAIAERFDEAIKACADGAASCSRDVHMLQGRRAWIEARRRRLPEAVSLMQDVLAENSSYVWGWSQLVSWLLEQESFTEAASALEQLQRLLPRDSWVNRQLGFLRLRQSDLAGAKAAFAAALDSSPTDSSAAHNLLDLQLQEPDLAAASATIEIMRTHQPGAATLAAEILLRLRQKDFKSALEILEGLAFSPDPDPWAVNAASDAFQHAGKGKAALRLLKRVMKSGSGNPQLGAAVIRLLAARRSPGAAAWCFLRLSPGELQRRAAAPLVHTLAENRSEILLRWVLWRRRQTLFHDDAAWGQVGYALCNFNRMKQVARWLGDWRQRPNVEPWMLFNYCLALRHMGRYDEAGAVARHVLETWGHREGSADMHLFLAVEEALAGAVPAAQMHLQQAVVRDQNSHDEQLSALAAALIAFQSVPLNERRSAFAAARRILSPKFTAWQTAHSLRDIRRTFWRAGQFLSSEGAGSGAWLWFKWKLHWQWLLLPLAPVAIAIAIQPPVLLGLLIWRLTRNRK